MKTNIFKIFLFDFLISTAVVFTVGLNSCSCVPCQQQEESNIPLDVLRKSDQFIISKTGSDFFKKYITIDFVQSKHINSNYFMVYRFYMPEKSFVDETISFTTDSTGKILKQYEVFGIPECSSDPAGCNFTVDEKNAKQIASENGLPAGIKEWKTDFIWSGQYKKYVWEIISTNKATNNQDNYRAEGEKIIIDAANSEVLSKDSWRIN